MAVQIPRGEQKSDEAVAPQNVTVLIPHLKGGDERLLKEAIGSFGKHTRYIISENEGNLADALNAGFREAQTEYVLVFSDDDVANRQLVPFLEGLAWDVDVTYPSMVLTDEQLKPFRFLPAAPFCPNRLRKEPYIPGSALFRREKVLEVGGYRELPAFEDWDLQVRLLQAGARFKAVPEAQFQYRQREGSRNRTDVPETLWDEISDPPELEATFLYQATYPTTYVRCLLPARYLPGQAIDIYHMAADGGEFPAFEGALVLQFPGDRVRGFMALSEMSRDRKVFVECDDNYLKVWKHPLIPESQWTDDPAEHSSTEGHRMIVQACDGVIVSTNELKKRYSKLNKNTRVIPNFVDASDWPPLMERSGPFTIGWFGSSSHRPDAKLVQPALEWASKQPDVQVVMMGVGANRVVYDEDLVREPWFDFSYRQIPWTNDISVYRKMLGVADVALAPVVKGEHASCRSDVKALEYAMAGCAPVLSTGAPYVDWKDGEGCLKAGSSSEFLKKVKWLVQNRDEAKALARDAKAYTLKHRQIQDNVWRYKEVFEDG